MPLGPPDDPERFEEFEECVQAIMDPPETTREEAERICGSWEQNQNAENRAVILSAARHRVANAVDPTQTKTLRARFSAEARRRVRDIASTVTEAIVENDVLGLEIEAPRGAALAANASGQTFRAQQVPPPGAFAFPQDSQKVQTFMDWLDEQVAAGLLERTQNPAAGMSGVTSDWANTYIRRASRKGVAHADTALRAQGMDVDTTDLDAIFRSPRHANTEGLAFTRAYRQLNGISATMDTEISRVLANGLAQGWGPATMGREIGSTITGIGTQRGTLIAQTESIRAFNENALYRYENFGVDEVNGQAEFRTAQDSKVCEQCAGLDGQTFPIKDAHGVLPIHPRCRCTWLPVL